MAKVIGGLHGRAAGNVGGIIYGAARSREGKVVTARELVIPANPRTGAQQNQRDKFKSSMMTVRSIGPDTYADQWNRSVGQLPGFHSLESILLGVINDENTFDVAPSDTPLGTLHFPDDGFTWQGAAAGFTVTWSTEVGDNGAAGDVVNLRCVKAAPETDLDHLVFKESAAKTRSQGTGSIVGLEASTSYLVVAWLDGALLGTARLSLADWQIGATTA